MYPVKYKYQWGDLQPLLYSYQWRNMNPLNAELNPIYHLLALLGAHHILHVSRIRVNPVKYRYQWVVIQPLLCRYQWRNIHPFQYNY